MIGIFLLLEHTNPFRRLVFSDDLLVWFKFSFYVDWKRILIASLITGTAIILLVCLLSYIYFPYAFTVYLVEWV